MSDIFPRAARSDSYTGSPLPRPAHTPLSGGESVTQVSGISLIYHHWFNMRQHVQAPHAQGTFHPTASVFHDTAS